MIESAMQGAWDELTTRLRPFIARRVAPSDADDVLQDVLLRMQRALPNLRDDERFGPWAYRVTRNAIVDHLRASARREALVSASDCDAHEAADVDDEYPAEQELATYVAAFVSLLPSPYREALTLTELEGLTQREAAEMMDISLSGMKSRVQRGRQLLRDALEDCCRIALDARGRVIACEPRPDGKLPGCACRNG
ncbi:MAG: sigma-70 family RNA polymerase sigma factor [Polyangiaceae bacterium]